MLKRSVTGIDTGDRASPAVRRGAGFSTSCIWAVRRGRLRGRSFAARRPTGASRPHRRARCVTSLWQGH